MATARQAQNLIQRNKAATLYKIGNSGQRVLSLGSFSSRLATQATDAIDQDYTRRYNDGLVTPEEYIKHLSEMQSRSGLTPTQRTQVSDMVRDVKRNQEISLLQANYDKAEAGTPAKAAAAEALGKFYETQAANLGAGTPAQADAQGNAAKWKQQATTVTANIQKTERTNLRYAELAKVAALPAGDPNSAIKKAEVYAKLRDEAFADGEINEGNRYEAAMQGEIQRAEKLQIAAGEAEVKGMKTDIISGMNQALNDYQDGKMGPYDALSVIDKAEALADQTGDYTLALRINAQREKIEKAIEAENKKGVGGFKKSLKEQMDTIELDVKNLETAYKYGTTFKPQSEFFKQLEKQAGPQGFGQVDLTDVLNGRAFGFDALTNLVGQAEAAGVDIDEGRRATINTETAKASNNIETYQAGRLVTYVDPGTNQVVFQDVDSQEELNNYFTPQAGGLSAKYDELKPSAVFDPVNQMLLTTNPKQQPTTLTGGLRVNNKFWGDTQIDYEVGLYRTADGGYAVNAKDVGLSEDDTVFFRVTDPGDGGLRIEKDDVVRPAKVVTVPSPDGGFDKIFIDTDAAGNPTSYFSDRMGRALQLEELNSFLRGRGGQELEQIGADPNQQGTDPNAQQEQPRVIEARIGMDERPAPPGPAAPMNEIRDYAAANPDFNSTIAKWGETMPQFKTQNYGSAPGNQTITPQTPSINPNKLYLASPTPGALNKPIPGVMIPSPSTQGLSTPQPGIPKQPSVAENLWGGVQKLFGKGTFW